MLISDVLRRKGDLVVTVPPVTSVAQLLSTLAEHNIGALVISSDGSRVDGIVSERDVVRVLPAHGAGALEAPVSSIMTVDVAVAAPGDTVEGLMGLMTEHRIRHVPVVEAGRLVGIISIGDVVKSRMDQLVSEKESLIGYISSG